MLNIEPTAEHQIPFDLSDEQPKTHADSVAIAVNTADFIEQLEGSLDYDDKALNQAGKLITGAEKPATPRTVSVSSEAKAASVLVKRFDFQAFSDQLQARNFITNKLITLADSGDPKIELKALELLGKHSDIGLFTERSEITIHHTTSSSLESSIKERIKRLMNADVIDLKPNMMAELDELDEYVQKTPENEHVDADMSTKEPMQGFEEGPIECPVCKETGNPIPTCGCVTYDKK
jgi:hypothetical protein